MNRWLLIASFAGLLAISTGCLHHNTRGGCSSCSGENACSGGCETSNCGSCGSSEYGGDCGSGNCGDNCGNGSCGTASCGPSGCGLIGKGRGRLAGCRTGCGRQCQAGPLGWQQGGLDYSSHLDPGCLGHNAGNAVAGQPFQAGAPSAQVAYPYYTHRGPRDFLQANPPSIGP